MDICENEYDLKPKKSSPYADSPYECAYIEQQDPEMPRAPKPEKKKRSRKPLVVVVLLAVCCGLTAWAVTGVWQNRFARMETAMQERFAALEQLYSQSHDQTQNSQLPSAGPMTPGQVYAQNVQAVVVVNARYESAVGGGQSAGSGFLISADGYVVTNYHVIENATQISVTPHSGESLTAEVVGFEATSDVALLKVEGEKLPFVTFGSSDKLEVGDMVAAIGNPLGELTSTLTVGYVSGKDRIVSTDGSVINMLQTDAAINSGNSGGPLFNMNGEVVGITTAKYTGNSNSGATIEGLGFAIPVDDVAGILSDLKEYGYVTGAYLGVYVRDVDSSAQSYGLPAGAFVEDVYQNTAADRAGICKGDIIVNLGGYEVDSLTSLTRALRRLEAGQTVSVTVFRSGKQEYLSVTLDEKPVEEPSAEPEDSQNSQTDRFENWFDYFFPFYGG